MTDGQHPQFPDNLFRTGPGDSRDRQFGLEPEKTAQQPLPPEAARFTSAAAPATPVVQIAEPVEVKKPKKLNPAAVVSIIVLSIGVMSVNTYMMYKNRKKNVDEVKQINASSLEKFNKRTQKPRDPLSAQAKYDTRILKGSLTIIDNQEKKFKPQVERALQLIWEADRAVFDDIKRNIYVIRMGDVTDFKIESGVPTIVLTGRTAFRSTTWCAGAIAHQLFVARNHFALKREEKLKSLPPGLAPASSDSATEMAAIPVDYSDMDSIEAFEKQADAFQLNIMRLINAPSNEQNAIRNRPAYDYSFTHDGIYQPGT